MIELADALFQVSWRLALSAVLLLFALVGFSALSLRIRRMVRRGSKV